MNGNGHGTVVLDGRHLTVEDVARIAAGAPVEVAPQGRDRSEQAWRAARAAARHQAVYGRTTDVGAAKGRALRAGEHEDGCSLLLQHAFAVGPAVPHDIVRAAVAVRANQLAAGGSGCRPGVLDALVDALAAGALPTVHDGGSLGTGDLAQLAEVGLALSAHVSLDRHDALALMSSSAFSLARGALVARQLRGWIDASLVVASASVRALEADTGFTAPSLFVARHQPGADAAAAQVRTRLGEATWTPHSVQAAFGVRCLPQVTGALDEVAGHLSSVLASEINASGENPLVDVADGRALHHGGFHQVRFALATDTCRLALHQAASLSVARLAELLDPEASGWVAGDGRAGGSHRLLGLEYAAQAALARVRQAAQPVTVGTATLARGAEPHVPFAPQGVHQLDTARRAADEVLACELVAASAAMHDKGITPPAAIAGHLVDAASDAPVRTLILAALALIRRDDGDAHEE